MSMAFTFVALSPALTSFRDQMSESYSDCSWQPVAHPPSHPPPPWPLVPRAARRVHPYGGAKGRPLPAAPGGGALIGPTKVAAL